MKMWLVNTIESVLRPIGPHCPVKRFGGLAEILVHDATHKKVLNRHLQRHMVDLAGIKMPQIAANIFDSPVRRLASWLPGVIVTDIDNVGFHLAAMDLEHVVFEDSR